MSSWAETQGRMISGEMASSQGFYQSSNSYQTYYEPVVVYQYEINGVEYTGTRVTQHALRYGFASDVQKFLAEHPIGSAVTVYYDPADPAQSFLEKGLGSMGQKQMALAGGVFAGILAAFGGLSAAMVAFTLILICVITLIVLLALGVGGAIFYRLTGG